MSIISVSNVVVGVSVGGRRRRGAEQSSQQAIVGLAEGVDVLDLGSGPRRGVELGRLLLPSPPKKAWIEAWAFSCWCVMLGMELALVRLEREGVGEGVRGGVP